MLVCQMWMCFWSASLLPNLQCVCGSDSCCNQMTKDNMANNANGDEEHSDGEDDADEDDD